MQSSFNLTWLKFSPFVYSIDQCRKPLCPSSFQITRCKVIEASFSLWACECWRLLTSVVVGCFSQWYGWLTDCGDFSSNCHCGCYLCSPVCSIPFCPLLWNYNNCSYVLNATLVWAFCRFLLLIIYSAHKTSAIKGIVLAISHIKN